jgi:hypothetical protein
MEINQFVDVALPGADRAQRHDVSPALLRALGEGNGVLVDIETNEQGPGRLSHG